MEGQVLPEDPEVTTSTHSAPAGESQVTCLPSQVVSKDAEGQWKQVPTVMGSILAGGVGTAGLIAEGAVLGYNAGEIWHSCLPG